MRKRNFFIICIMAAAFGIVTNVSAMPLYRFQRETAPLPTPREEARAILECIYRGLPDSALALAAAFEKKHPGDPLPLLITARVMRETLSDQDDEKKLIEESARPILAMLARAISICDEQLQGGAPDARFYFYRGWGLLFKAQLDALSANYWSAGRSAKKGKNDLERFLELRPGDPDAGGILGTFLYFADTLPTVVKIIKTFLLIPGGDRERGLELLRNASAEEAMLSIDHEILLSAIYTIFEGRFEEGLHSFSSLLQDYPAYLRLAEPIGAIAALRPREIRSFQAVLERTVMRHLDGNQGTVDWPAIHRIRYHRSYSAMLYDPPHRSIEAFETLIAGAPERPDWLMPLSMIDLGMLYANTARPEKAEAMFEAVIADGKMKRFHDVAEKMLESLDEGEGRLTGAYPQLVAALYDGRLEESRILFEAFERSAGGTVYYDFYRGELELLSGDNDAAGRWYHSALDRRVPAYAQIYQLLAAARLAELYGLRHEFDAVDELLGEALRYYHKEFLIDMLIEGRKRFYRRYSDAEPASESRNRLFDAGPPRSASVVEP